MQANSMNMVAEATSAAEGICDTVPASFDEIPDFDAADFSAVWSAFLDASRAIVDGSPALRAGKPASAALRAVCERAITAGRELTGADVRSFILANFVPHRLCRDGRELDAFFTGYYRPEVAASRQTAANFQAPLLARPADLVSPLPADEMSLPPGFSGGRRGSSGALEIYPSRAEIDGGALDGLTQPIAFVRDAVEAFLIHVQGSARLRFDDGSCVDLTYAGRNGHPYSSIGKRLVANGEVPASEISMDRLKDWVRRHGQDPGERGLTLLHTNPSYVFFSERPSDVDASGPIGAAGLPLRPLTSIAVDRSRWPYGLPFWITADMAWESAAQSRFSRLVLAQDTGSAIVGPARADIYFGTGVEAGCLAGDIRHHGRMLVFLPRLAT